MKLETLAALSVLALTPLCLAQDGPVAIRGATLYTGTGEVIEDGTLVFNDGEIVAIGADISPPEGAEVIEAEGLFATPGFIDAYTHAGLQFSSVAERQTLVAASRRIADAIELRSGASEWLRSGVTTTYVSPGAQNLVGGLGAVIKLTGTVVRDAAGLSVSYGETALDAFDAPTTRQGMVAILRQTLVRAQEDALAEDDGRTFALVLTDELPFRVLANTPDDLLTALRLAEEFGLKLILDSAAGGHVVADAIAAAGVPVVVGPSIVGIGDGGPYEGFAHTPANAGALHRAGVRIALGTEGFGRGRSVAMEAVVAKAHGLPEEAALRAVTSDAAAILGVEDRLGSLAAGMDADIVLWDGRPITTWARTTRVIVNGETVFER